MLVLSRKKGESLMIGDSIELTVLEINGDVIKIGISAPREVSLLRKELYVSVENMNKDAVSSELSTADLVKQFGAIKTQLSQHEIGR